MSTAPPIPVWIAQTKLHPPRVRTDAIERPRLLDVLRLAADTAPVTLLSAPAGSGKTTLLATWLQQPAVGSRQLADPSAANCELPTARVAWLSLDEGDDDPAGFLLALVAALRQ